MCTLTIWSSVFCVLMVEGMSVVVNVMMSLTNVMRPPWLVRPSDAHGDEVMRVGSFAFGVSLDSWIVMISACVLWISRLSFSSLFLIPFMLIWGIMRFLLLLLLGLCACVVCIVYEVVLVPYVVGVVVLVTLMRVLLFVLDASMLRECEGDGNADMRYGEVWLRWVRGMSMWVVHVIQVLCLVQPTFEEWV